MSDILVPIFVCVVLPVSIVLITAFVKINGENKRSQIILKAIEANRDIDAEKLIESLKKVQKTPREILNGRLLRGCMFTLIGIILTVLGIINLASGFVFSEAEVTMPVLLGGIAMAIGVSFLIVWFITRKQILTEEVEK